MRKATIFIVASFLLVVCAMPVHAQGIPPLPQAFYGNVTIDGNPAPVGTIIEARGTGVLTGITGNPITTTEVGKYGKAGALEPKLIVQGDISDEAEIEFLVNGIYTSQTYAFQSGETTQFNLALVITGASITAKKVVTVPAGQTNYVIDASVEAGTTITVSTTAEVTITVKKYYGNPHPEVALPAEMLPRYIDIEVSNLDAIIWPIHVEQTYTDAEVAGLVESSLGMYCFKAGAWHRCSDTGVNTVANYIWANMTRDELSGSPVAVGGTATPAPGGGGPGVRDTTPPTISDILVSNITKTSADISWKTDEKSDSQVEYWTSPSKLSPLDTAMVINHLVHLTDLTPGTTYHYKTMSRDAAGNLAVSDEHTFTTLPVPAAFTASKLSISPDEVYVGETVTISALITNTGDGAGGYTATLKINSVVEATKDITLNAGASQEVTFTTVKDVAGSYSVEVDGLTGSFTVKEKPTPPPTTPPVTPPPVKAPIKWPLIGGIIAGVLVVGLLIFFLARRRAA
jgi:hypothetical protein